MAFGHGVFDRSGFSTLFRTESSKLDGWPSPDPKYADDTNAPTDGSSLTKPVYTIYKRFQPINNRYYVIDYTAHDGTTKSRLEDSLASAKSSAANPPAGFEVPSGYWIDLTATPSSTAPAWDPCSPTDAVASAWSEWSECTDGTKTRTRTIDTPAFCGGLTPSSDTLTEDEACVEDEDDSTDDSTTTDDGTDDTTVTTQSTGVTAVAPASGMSSTMKGVIALVVLGGAAFFISKRKK